MLFFVKHLERSISVVTKIGNFPHFTGISTGNFPLNFFETSKNYRKRVDWFYIFEVEICTGIMWSKRIRFRQCYEVYCSYLSLLVSFIQVCCLVLKSEISDIWKRLKLWKHIFFSFINFLNGNQCLVCPLQEYSCQKNETPKMIHYTYFLLDTPIYQPKPVSPYYKVSLKRAEKKKKVGVSKIFEHTSQQISFYTFKLLRRDQEAISLYANGNGLEWNGEWGMASLRRQAIKCNISWRFVRPFLIFFLGDGKKVIGRYDGCSSGGWIGLLIKWWEVEEEEIEHVMELGERWSICRATEIV